MRLGVHVSISGHIYESVSRAEALGCNTMQIFSRDPRQWRKGRLELKDIEEFRKRKAHSDIKPIFAHIPYLINLASPYSVLHKNSIKGCVEDVKEAQLLGIEFIVLHPGSHKKSGEKKGIRRVTAALNKILERTKNTSVAILLENTSGSGSWLGYKFEHHRQIIDGIEQKNRIGLCFDTCHAYCAGYDLANKAGYKDTVNKLERIVGLKNLKLIHLNDCKDKLSSKHDRHEHIGKGEIGLEGFRRLLNDSRFKDIPFILETPKDSVDADKINLEVVRGLKK